ncbi:MAG: GNAT family N-acetyltransferase [Lysobacter sp.]
MSSAPAFSVAAVEYESALPDLRSVRETVFVQEQNVPLDLEWDELDPLCRHVLARDNEGRPIGTGRLVPPLLSVQAWTARESADAAPAEARQDPRRTRLVDPGHDSPSSSSARIGRMAVLADWRGRGVGNALLLALIDEARRLGWREVSLHAQVSAIGFYVRHGFLPYDAPFVEAGIGHQAMRRLIDKPNPVETRAAALAASLGVIAGARRSLQIYSRELDPGLLDTPEAVAALRQFATQGGETRVLLQDPGTPQRVLSPLIGLAQRLPSAFAFRAVEEPGDLAYASAFVVNDRGGWYFRTLGHRFDGETHLHGEPRARQLRAAFEPMWERARPCTEYRSLGI